MAYSYDKKSGQITISGWEQGIAPSPHKGNGMNGSAGVADLKGVNISSIPGEVSVAYNRVRQDNVPVASGTMTNTGSSTTFGYSATNLTNGTWILVTGGITGSPGVTVNNYYFAVVNLVGVSYFLYSDMGVTQITSGGGASSFTFSTVDMGPPIDYAVQQNSAGSSFRYYILDANGIIWANGTTTTAATSFNSVGLNSLTTWQAITPQGTSTNSVDTFSGNQANCGSIQVMYATDSSNVIKASYLMVFGKTQIKWCKNDTSTPFTNGWPSLSGSPLTVWKSLNSTSATSHKSTLGIDGTIYFCDGPGIGIIGQVAGALFNPAGTLNVDYYYSNANYNLPPTDAATRVVMISLGNGLAIVVGGQENNIYFFVQFSQSSKTSANLPYLILWMPESNTQFLLPTNNYVLIFAGNKGNIYLTNGSTIVPILTVPDYIAGSANFVQDPYFTWGGAMYLRGRVFFSIKDQTATHTGNCGGVWSFVPSFSYYPNQDMGLALRMEDASSQYATHGFNGVAQVLFAGQEITAQQNDGPQYIAGWTQTTGVTTTNSIDFSGTVPLTNSSTIIETDAIPVGTFLEPKTFEQIEVKLASNLVTGESIVVNYRTDLEATWASAGTITSETALTGSGSPLSRIITPVTFQKVQFIQLQLILNSTVTNPSWCRVKEVYIR